MLEPDEDEPGSYADLAGDQYVASVGQVELPPLSASNDGDSTWIKGALIGDGSSARVYLGMNASDGLLVAVKQVELQPTAFVPDERRMLKLNALHREIEVLKGLKHNNIVQYLDSSSDGAYLSLFLEYIPGGSIASLLKNYGPFEESLAQNFVQQTLQGLDYLHERELIHCDIRGDHILVDNTGCIKIAAFGASRKVKHGLLEGMPHHHPMPQNSAFWMAPEVVKRIIYSVKTDIWSVGCLAIEMLTGDHPWASCTQMQAIFQIGSLARPAFPPSVSAHAEDFINKTVEIDYTLRPFASALLVHPWVIQD